MWKMKLIGGVALALMLGAAATRAQTPIPPAPKDFVSATLQGDQYELLAADVAETESDDSRVRSFAKEMIEAHTRLAREMRQAAETSGLPLVAPSLSSDQASLLASLQGGRGAVFDRTYARQQVLVHAQALAVAESFAAGGQDANLRKAAQSALPMIRDHLKKAEKLQLDLGAS